MQSSNSSRRPRHFIRTTAGTHAAPDIMGRSVSQSPSAMSSFTAEAGMAAGNVRWLVSEPECFAGQPVARDEEQGHSGWRTGSQLEPQQRQHQQGQRRHHQQGQQRQLRTHGKRIGGSLEELLCVKLLLNLGLHKVTATGKLTQGQKACCQSCKGQNRQVLLMLLAGAVCCRHMNRPAASRHPRTSSTRAARKVCATHAIQFCTIGPTQLLSMVSHQGVSPPTVCRCTVLEPARAS